jgi:mxaJ protein
MTSSTTRVGRALCVSAALVLSLFAGASAHPQAATPLRVCADPNYMPYSDTAGQGFENKIAQAVAHDLGRPVTYYWLSEKEVGDFGQYLQQTLLSGRCDVMMNVPYALVNAKTTKPYYISSYVFIYKRSKNYDLSSLDSPILKQVKIGYEADTPAEDGLKLRGLTPGNVPFLSADEPNRSPDDIVQAVESGKIDVGISWDPAVAYYAARHPDLAVKIVPNSRSTGSPEQYTFPMSMATRSNDPQLNAELDDVIKTHREQLESILREYHIRFFEPSTT